MPRTPTRVDGVRTSAKLLKFEEQYAEERAKQIGTVQDVIVEALRDTRTLFDLPVDAHQALEKERASQRLTERDYIRWVLNQHYVDLLLEHGKSAASSGKTARPPASQELGLRTSVHLPMLEYAYVNARAEVLGSPNDAMNEALRDMRTLFDVPLDTYELLEKERREKKLVPRDYVRWVLSQRHIKLLLAQMESTKGKGRG